MTSPKFKLLVIGDFACSTGFGTVNETLFKRVKALKPDWSLYIVGINATGDPHPLQREFMIYPAALYGADIFGVARAASIAQAVKPDLIFIHQDSWNIPGYVEALNKALEGSLPPIIAWCPPDSPNQWTTGQMMPDVDLVMCPTQFGVDEVFAGGYRGRLEVLPYGLDRALFTPGDRREARQAIGFHEEHLDDIIFGRADRNAPRKRYDLTIRHFAKWWHEKGRPDNVRMLFHCANTDPVGWHLGQLASYYNLDPGRVMLTAEDLHPGVLMPRERLANIYRSWDVHVSCTQGEGFGLIGVESAACGIPQMLPDYAAFGEIFRDGHLDLACFLRCTSVSTTPNAINTMGGVVDGGDLEWGFNHLYEDAGARKSYSELALRAASNPAFDWDRITEKFLMFCEEVVRGE